MLWLENDLRLRTLSQDGDSGERTKSHRRRELVINLKAANAPFVHFGSYLSDGRVIGRTLRICAASSSQKF